MKIVEILVIKNTVKSVVKDEIIFIKGETVEVNHFKDDSELRLFLIDNFELTIDDGIPNSRGMFSSRDNLSYFYDKENLCGHYRVYNYKPYEEIIEGKFKFIKVLKDSDNSYYEINKIDLSKLIN